MYNFTKRLIDLTFAITFLIIAMPVFFIVILLLSVTGDKEIFYLQERIGFKNKKFCILKFATMIKDGDYGGSGQFTVANDPRVTPLGRILRKTKLNELPQLINILKGDMSLVGPRPLTMEGFNRYSKAIQKSIYNIKPGLTGVGSIVFRDEIKLLNNYSDYESLYKQINAHKGKLELWYHQNCSFKVDMIIIFLTALTVIFPNQNLIYKIFKNLPLLEDEKEINLNVIKVPQNREPSGKRRLRNEVEFGM